MRLALPLEHVMEMLRPLETRSLPGMPPFVRGIAVVRGATAPVVDAGVLLDAKGAQAGHWVVLRVGDRRVVLAVEAVEGLREIAPASTSPLPPVVGEAIAAMVARVGALDESLLVVLRASSLLSELEWHTLDAASAGP